MIPATPPRASKVFNQWVQAWFHQCTMDSTNKTVIGTDGSYQVKGQGTAAFVVQCNNIMEFTSSQMVVVHSLYDAEMQAVHMAIVHISQQVMGPVIIFIDNQATLKSLFNTKPHSAFELSLANCKILGDCITQSQINTAKFRWIPSHLGFPINKLADAAAEANLIGPFPFPQHTIAS